MCDPQWDFGKQCRFQNCPPFSLRICCDLHTKETYLYKADQSAEETAEKEQYLEGWARLHASWGQWLC